MGLSKAILMVELNWIPARKEDIVRKLAQKATRNIAQLPWEWTI